MIRTETVIRGTIQPDGSLVLDHKPDLPAGRVTVVLRQESEVAMRTDDAFWQRMQAMWAIPTAEGAKHDGGESSVAELRRSREEWNQHQEAIERLQDECRPLPTRTEESEP
jgi:hypothetical protein